MSANYELGYAATVDLAKWLNEARRLESLFARAGWPVPPPIVAVLDGDVSPSPRVASSPLPPTKHGWVQIPLVEASTTSMAMAVLQKASKPMTASEIVREIQSYKGHEKVIDGTVMNLLTRKLYTKSVDRRDNRWFLVDKESAPEIQGDFLVADPDQMQKQEIAAYRRGMILSILADENSGLMLTQIVDKLDKSGCRATVNKDVLKLDLHALKEQGKVGRISNSRKWTLKGGAAYAAP